MFVDPLTSGLDSGVKLRPLEKDLNVIGDTFTERWLNYYVPRPDKPVLWLGTVGLYVLCDDISYGAQH